MDTAPMCQGCCHALGPHVHWPVSAKAMQASYPHVFQARTPWKLSPAGSTWVNLRKQWGDKGPAIPAHQLTQGPITGKCCLKKQHLTTASQQACLPSAQGNSACLPAVLNAGAQTNRVKATYDD